MYTEIVKIIESALSLDSQRVQSYAQVLAENLDRKGESKFASRIRAILARTHGTPATLDSFAVKPVDSESHLDIVDVTFPSFEEDQLVLDTFLQKEIENFVAAFLRRDDFARIGASAPNKLLLYGPPGCGKTSLAKDIAARARLPLVTARFDTLVSSLLGSTSKNIRKVFDYAVRKPCVLFLDEFDVIAKMRDDKNELGELKRVVNGLLQEMDSFSSGSILIAASNHHELLDSAVWRRFDKTLLIDLPTEQTITRLLSLYLKGRDDGFATDRREMKRLAATLSGCSHSAVHTCVMNALRDTIVEGFGKVSSCDIVKEAYLLRHHAFTNDADYASFLLDSGYAIRFIHAKTGLPERLLRKASRKRNLRRSK